MMFGAVVLGHLHVLLAKGTVQCPCQVVICSGLVFGAVVLGNMHVLLMNTAVQCPC